MTIEKICLLLKTMQYIIMMAHRKGLCDDICPMRCHHPPFYGVPGHYPHHLGPRYGHVSQPNQPDLNVDIENLARAMGVPKTMFSDLISNTSSIRDQTTKSPLNGKAPKGTRPPIDKDAVQFMDTDYQSDFRFSFSEDKCTTPNGEFGSCYNIRSCEPLLDLLRNSRSIPGAIPYLRQSLCGYEGNDPIVCCPSGIQTSAPPVNPQYTLPTLDDNCGLSNGTLLKRVVKGENASLGAWPWMAVLGYKSRKNPGSPAWQCGGTLITRRHVLTAAHCVHNHENDLYIVRLGDLDLAADDDGASPIDVPIELKIKHEEYSPKQYTNDIAILKLEYDVSFSNLILPICMPTTPDLRMESYENKLPFIAGWGATEYQGLAASRLQQLQIPTVTNEQCKQAYTRFKAQVIDERVLCAGYAKGGKDACQGDSGGPLMFPQFPADRNQLHYYLIGIVSYGFKCAEPGYPGVYTRTTHFLPWIESHLND